MATLYEHISLNKRKSIGNYNMVRCNDIIQQIDKILIEELQLGSNFFDFLQNFYREHVSAGRDNFNIFRIQLF